MRFDRERDFQRGLIIVIAALMLAPGQVSSAGTANPFDSLLGAWTGSGEFVLRGGQWESVKCNAYYTGGGSGLRVAVRCASSSYRVEIRSKLTRAKDRISGTWEERTYNAVGSVRGRALADRLNLSIRGGGFYGSMSVSYGSSEQSVSLSTEGIKLKSVSMTLSRMSE